MGGGQTKKHDNRHKPNLGQTTADETKLVLGVVSSSIKLCIYSKQQCVCLVCYLYLVLTGTPEEWPWQLASEVVSNTSDDSEAYLCDLRRSGVCNSIQTCV